MGLTNNLGKLSNMITSTGSAVGIAQPSPAYTLDVTGTGRFTSTLLVSGAATFGSTITASGNLNLQAGATRNINFYDSSNTNINAQIQYDQIASNSGQLFFGTNNAGTFATRLTITNAGHVGIDVVPSNWQYSVVGGILQVGNSSIYEYGNYEVGLQVNCYYNSGWKYIASGSTTSTQILLTDGNILFNNAVAGTAGNAITFTERMRITSGGGLVIGGTANPRDAYLTLGKTNGGGEALNCYGWGNGYGYGIWMQPHSSASGTHYPMSFRNPANTEVGYISSNSSNTVFSTSGSDFRLKNNIEDWDEEVLPYFSNIKPKTFFFNTDEEGMPKSKGYIAQDNIDKFPEAYPINADGFYTFNPDGMVVYLMKAIQELSKQNEELSNRLIKLENK
jgi:hypothetical protein